MESASPTLERAQPQIDLEMYERHFEELLVGFEGACDYYNVPPQWRVATQRILHEVRCAYEGQAPWIACDSLQGLPLALTAAHAIDEFWSTEVNKPAVICGYALHDNGKIDLPYELNLKSFLGEEWDPEKDGEAMRPHVVTGYQRAAEHGLPLIVTRPIAESHGKQLSPCHGMDPRLSPEELHVRNAIAIGDAIDAMFERDNTYNKHLSSELRNSYREKYIRNICNDYDNGGPQLAELIIARVAPRLEIAVAY